MTVDSPPQRARAARLTQLVQDRLSQLDLAVRLTTAGRGEEARLYIKAGTGRTTMEEIRVLVAKMRAEERELLRARDERSGSTARSLMTTLGIGGALLFAFLIVIWWLIRSDLARRNRAEAAIRDREARIRRLVDANLIGVLFSNDGGVTDANDAFLSIVGLDRETFKPGQHRLFGFTAPEFRELDENCEKELRESGTCRPYQKELVRPDGSRVPVLFGATNVEMGGAVPVRASFVVDLSELKRVEAERNRLYEEARDAVKARDAFLSVAGHEIRTPLSALNLIVYQLTRQVRALGNEKAVDLALRCEKQVSRLIRLADELLDVSRMSSARLHLSPEEMDARPARAGRARAVRGERPPRGLRARAPRAATRHGLLGPAEARPGPVEPAHERDEVRRRRADRRRAVGGRHGGDPFGRGPRHRHSRRGPAAHLRAVPARADGRHVSGNGPGPLDHAGDRRGARREDFRREPAGGGRHVPDVSAPPDGRRE